MSCFGDGGYPPSQTFRQLSHLLASSVVIFHCSNVSNFELHHGKETQHLKNIEATESRYNIYDQWPSQYERRDVDLSVTLNVPNHNARDYWYYNHEFDSKHRKFFLENYNLGDHIEKKPSLPMISDLYHFMKNIFGGRNIGREPVHYFRHSSVGPQRLSNPMAYKQPKTAFLSQKPIRASVIKLETVTKHPIRYSLQHYTEGAINNPLFEKPNNNFFDQLYSKDHISTLANPPQTTSSEKLPIFFKKENQVGHIPVEYSCRPDKTYVRLTSGNHSRQKENVLSIIPTPYRVIKKHFPDKSNSSSTRYAVFPTGDSNRLLNTNKIAGHEIKLPNVENRESIEMIANLTAEGLSSSEIERLNIQTYINHVNLRNLVQYEITKLEKGGNVPNVRFGSLVNGTINPMLINRKSVNLNDDLSLDAKILKDTNWDGLTTTMRTAVHHLMETLPQTGKKSLPFVVSEQKTEEPFFIIKPILEFKPTMPLELRRVKDFWEINTENETMTVVHNEHTTEVSGKTTNTALTTGHQELVTITEPSSISKPPNMGIESEEKTATPTEAQTTPAVPSEIAKQPFATIEEITTISSSKEKLPEAANMMALTKFLRRKYCRKEKMLNFSSASPVVTQKTKQSIRSRSHFQKRTKPNVTLAIGRKNKIYSRQMYNFEEMMKFSDEDGRRREGHIDSKGLGNLTSKGSY
ncbi:hypothetical protein RUM44_005827 [Polyplax serrata]|uniref:Uncharacterized protein n=1 Tax=Polyplax serrata TaxID=468196 RepID=A0ABR1B014_POLSC